MTAPAAPSALQAGGTRPKLLDCFSGAGGAARGYQMAGFSVTGVDIKPQKRYAGDVFVQGDALEYLREHGHEYDAIHTSPPCQAFTSLRHMPNAKPHQDLLTPTRAILKELGKPYVIENVPGAPMSNYIVLCGSMFGLGTGDAELRRHRHFEINPMPFFVPPCRHNERARVIGVYGGHGRDRRRVVTVTGHAGGKSVRDGTQQFSTEARREAMGIDWMAGDELSQAIPPAYTKWIGDHLMMTIAPLTPAAPTRTVRKLFSPTRSYPAGPLLLAESRRQYPHAIAVYANSATIATFRLSDCVADDRVPKGLLEVEVEAGTR